MRLLVCVEGPLLAEEIVTLMNAVTDIAPEAVVEMPDQPTTFTVDKGDASVHIGWDDIQLGVRGRAVAEGTEAGGD